jgi:hypothetical protein
VTGSEEGGDMARDADDELFDRLAATLRGAEEPPEDVVEFARASFGLHRLDAELAELVADSALEATPAGVRHSGHGPRMLTFEAGDAEIEVQIAAVGNSGWQVLGQVVPPAPAAVRIEPADPALAAVESVADELGRFAARLTGGGAWRLICRRPGLPLVVSPWIALG